MENDLKDGSENDFMNGSGKILEGLIGKIIPRTGWENHQEDGTRIIKRTGDKEGQNQKNHLKDDLGEW